jgi:hypothetical protein
MTFDPSAPGAARWRRWLDDGLAARGVPANASLEIHVRPACEAAVTRFLIDLRWAMPNGQGRAHAEALVPIRRVLGNGWSGWPAYLAGVRLLRSLD